MNVEMFSPSKTFHILRLNFKSFKALCNKLSRIILKLNPPYVA